MTLPFNEPVATRRPGERVSDREPRAAAEKVAAAMGSSD